jgi:hypothetical protein
MDVECLICGLPKVAEHHPTARIAGDFSPYLDPELHLPACHDDHELFGDDQKRQVDLEPNLSSERATVLDWLEVRLRRLAAFGGRCAEAIVNETLRTFVAALAQHLDRWANELACAIAGLNRAFPTWRTIPEVHG